MAHSLLVNLKKGQQKIKTLAFIQRSDKGRKYLFDYAMDIIQNHFHVYVKTFEIHESKNVTDYHWYAKITPTGKKEHATIIIDYIK